MIQRREFLRYGAAASGLAATAAFGQGAWPEKPVRIVVLFPAGGASDVLTRMLAEKLQARFSQTFVIENLTGAGGNIGMAAVMNAPADGYTIASATIGTLSINQFLYSKMSYDPAKDFAYVSTFWENCNVFAVSSGHPARTLQEFIAWARRKPQGVTFSSSGVGTTPHLAGELFGVQAGVKVVHVPFRGSANTEVVAGSAAISRTACDSWLVMAAGVAAGITSAPQEVTTKSVMPASAMVGTSGNVGQRSGEVTASARARPERSIGV